MKSNMSIALFLSLVCFLANTTYSCRILDCYGTCAYGQVKDSRGCPTCECCQSLRCPQFCWRLVVARDYNGCITCKCIWALG